MRSPLRSNGLDLTVFGLDVLGSEEGYRLDRGDAVLMLWPSASAPAANPVPAAPRARSFHSSSPDESEDVEDELLDCGFERVYTYATA